MVADDVFEIGEDPPPRSTVGTPSRRTRRPHRSRGPAPWAAAAVVLVVAGAAVAGPPTLVAGRGSGVSLGLSDRDLTRPPDIAWEAPVGGTNPLGWTDDVLVVHPVDPATGGQAPGLTGLDRRTGATLWTSPDVAGCLMPGRDPVCVIATAERDAVVVALDVADGDEERTPYPGAIAGLRVADGLVVVVAPVGDDREEDVLLLEHDGTERWRVRLDVADADHLTYLWQDGDAVLAGWGNQRIDLATGAVERPEQLDELPWIETDTVTAGEDGGVAHTEHGDVPLAAGELGGWLDDDLGGPVVLLAQDDGTLLARLRVDGRDLWRTDASCGVAARLTGVVLVGRCPGLSTSGAPETTALDEVTGEVLWSRPGVGWASMAASDGTVVLEGMDGATAVAAVDIGTGETLWDLEAPDTSAAWVGWQPTADGWLLSTEDSLHLWEWSE